MDPHTTEDGKLYAPERLKEIIKERYLIAKNLNTSYIDTGKLTCLERTYLLNLMDEERKRAKEQIDEIRRNKKRK